MAYVYQEILLPHGDHTIRKSPSIDHRGFPSNRGIQVTGPDADQTSSVTASEWSLAWQTWLKTPLGQELLRQEYALLSELCMELFGYQLLQVGELGSDTAYLDASPARSRSVIGLGGPTSQQQVQLLSSSGALPVKSASVDAVILPHSLDFSVDPHQLLREVERILIPEGHLVILGFNPISLWGVTRLVMRVLHRGDRMPWCGSFLSFFRLQDWLSLLGFDLERTEVLMFRPPVQRESIMQRFHFLDEMGQGYFPMLAGVYGVRVVKRVSTLRPIGLTSHRFLSLRSARNRSMEPTTRGVGRS